MELSERERERERETGRREGGREAGRGKEASGEGRGRKIGKEDISSLLEANILSIGFPGGWPQSSPVHLYPEGLRSNLSKK